MSKEPLHIDLLIIKKRTDAVIQNEIGRIFRGYNVIEFKSPDDNLTIDDFYKTIGYACLYKGLGETVNKIPAEELTISIFRDSYPHKMMAALQQSGMTIKERFQGIYYVSGQLPFPAQVVVTGQLKRDHRSLRILSKNADENDVRAFLKEMDSVLVPGDRENVRAVIGVSSAANGEVYEKIGRSNIMSVLDKWIGEELLEAENRGIQEGKQEGIQQGIKEGIQKGTLQSLVNVMKSLSLDADRAMDALNIPMEERGLYRSQLQ